MDYYITSTIHLSLEEYHNEGITPEQSKELIESLPDPCSSYSNLRCSKSGINNNWNVHIFACSMDDIKTIVLMIEEALEKILFEKRLLDKCTIS